MRFIGKIDEAMPIGLAAVEIPIGIGSEDRRERVFPLSEDGEVGSWKGCERIASISRL
jgi:hypothetical protein